MAHKNPLETYRAKRNFSVTPEPGDSGTPSDSQPAFVIQKHWARTLHYDLRLELDGSMKSWAVPKGPSLDPADKRMAIQVEDHPLSYNQFEGQIPEGEYGAGKVIIWDRGTWIPEQNPRKAYQAGKLKFSLEGEKLHGRWALVRMRGKSERQIPWLLIKEQDEYARPTSVFSVVEKLPHGVGPAKGRPATSTTKAKPVDLPATLQPQLATLSDAPPSNPHGWIYEIKFDGYRMLARQDEQKLQLISRNGHDWTTRLPQLAQALKKMKLPPGWYDGEIVMMNDQNLPDFQALQNAFDSASTADIRYYLFDLPYFKDIDMRGLPLIDRRAVLEQALRSSGPNASGKVLMSAALAASAHDIQASACKMGLEGIIAKRKDSPYISGRSTDWLKLKCGHRQEFVIGGYTDRKDSPNGVGALLLGVHDAQGKLRYAGKVGTGFNIQSLKALRTQLGSQQSGESPFIDNAPHTKTTHWVNPKLLAEVSFAQWTGSGRVRHAVFHGLRNDKSAATITREPIMPINKMKVTHPDRIVDRSTGTTKLDVVHYYTQAALLMMPHLKGRPVSLLRAPEGIKGQMFFQKHMDTSKMAGVRALPAKLDPDHEPLLEIATEQGLASAAQMNVLELHTWNALRSLIAKPDRMTFDLDPGKDVEWSAMQETAMLLRVLLRELALEPWVKTSGGKGLHVVVPLKRRHDWDTVKDTSEAIVQHLAKTFPKRFASKSGPRNRVGKIFIDYLRNGWGATTVSAWSLRARPGMGVSVPIAWDEVAQLTGATHWNIGNIHERLDIGNQPWEHYSDSAATLTQAMKILNRKRK